MSEEIEEIMDDEKSPLRLVWDLTSQPFIPSSFIMRVRTDIRKAYEEYKCNLNAKPWFVIRVGVSEKDGNITFGFFKHGCGTYDSTLSEAYLERVIVVNKIFAESIFNAALEMYQVWMSSIFPEYNLPSIRGDSSEYPVRIQGRLYSAKNRGIYLPINECELGI